MMFLWEDTPSLFLPIKSWLWDVSSMPIFHLIQLCHISPWLRAYISAQGGQQSVKIKGSDDKGGHEDGWICNRFIAVVKTLKVSEESAVTHLLRHLLENLLVGNNAQRRGEGWALVYLPGGDKKISCLTEWESFSCATTKSFTDHDLL